MKKNILIFLIAVSLGTLFAFYVFNGAKKTFAQIKSDNQAYAFQVGVFKIYENAVSEASKYASGTIIKDNDLYRVYIAITEDKNVKLSYQDYFEKLGINYYIKAIKLDEKCLKKINAYETMTKKTFNEDTYDNINKILLEYYKGGCND